jgi:hypothetical protein
MRLIESTAIVLPDLPFCFLHFKRIQREVQRLWGDRVVYFAFSNETAKYFSKNFRIKVNSFELIDNKMFLDNKLLLEYKQKYSVERFVIARNDLNCNPNFEWSSELNIKVYRDLGLGYLGLRKVGNFEDSRIKYNSKKNNSFVEAYQPLMGDESLYFLFPYGLYYYSSRFFDINDLGYRIPDKQLKLAAKRDTSKTKLVVVLGDSCAFGLTNEYCDTFPYRLEKKLNKFSQKDRLEYMVVNFSQPGGNILNNIITYMLYIRSLKPDIVVLHSSFCDFVMGQVSDSRLISTFDVSYQKFFLDWAISLHGADSSFKIFKNHDNKLEPINKPSVVLKYFLNRLLQFDKIVCDDVGKFIFGIQPLWYCKKYSDEEKILLKETIDGSYSMLYSNLQKMQNKLAKAMYGSKINWLNINECFKSTKDTVFVDLCHTTELGNDKIADMYCKFILDKEI